MVVVLPVNLSRSFVTRWMLFVVASGRIDRWLALKPRRPRTTRSDSSTLAFASLPLGRLFFYHCLQASIYCNSVYFYDECISVSDTGNTCVTSHGRITHRIHRARFAPLGSLRTWSRWQFRCAKCQRDSTGHSNARVRRREGCQPTATVPSQRRTWLGMEHELSSGPQWISEVSYAISRESRHASLILATDDLS